MGGLIVTNHMAGLDFLIGNVWFVCVCVCTLQKGEHSGVATNFPTSVGAEREQPKSKELFTNRETKTKRRKYSTVTVLTADYNISYL